MDWRITEVILSCSYRTYTLCHIQPLLTLDIAKMVDHSIVSSHPDYANALLHSTLANNLNRMQVARVVCQAPSSANATKLHQSSTGCQSTNVSPTRWQSSHTPAYLFHVIHDYLPACTLWSSDKLLLSVTQMALVLSLSIVLQRQRSFSLELTVI